MRPFQTFLFYVLGVLGLAALLGVPHSELAGPALIGAWVAAVGLAAELLDV